MTRIPAGQWLGPGPGRPLLGDRGRHPRGELGDLRALAGLAITVEGCAPQTLDLRKPKFPKQDRHFRTFRPRVEPQS